MDPPGPDQLERLREASGLSIDAEGRFLHRGEPITHARTLEALWRSLAAAPDGRWQVSLGREVGYVAVDETPWVVRAIRPEGRPLRAVTLLLVGGRELSLDPVTLRVAADGALRCRAAEGPVRFSRAGHLALGALLHEHPPGSGRYALTLAGRRFAVEPVAAGRPA